MISLSYHSPSLYEIYQQVGGGLAHESEIARFNNLFQITGNDLLNADRS